MSVMYHVLNRGVERRAIFMDNADRARFIHDLYEFNDTHPAPDAYRTMWDLRNPTLNRERQMIIDIHGWCLMRNHYHLLISERIEGGMSLFLRKLNIGYANYFNERYERSGTLFQGRTKKVLIDTDPHYLYILHYIHLNPLDTLAGAREWRAGTLASVRTALEHLNAYRWSSYLDYCHKKNFPSVITTDIFRGVFGDYKRVLSSYLQDMRLEPIRPFLLE